MNAGLEQLGRIGLPLPASSSAAQGSLSQNVAAGQSSAADFRSLLSSAIAPAAPDAASLGPADLLAKDTEQAEAEKNIKSAAQDFEALLVYQLLKEMWATIPESNVFGKSTAGQYFRELWLDEISRKIAGDGQGLGIAPIIEQELSSAAANAAAPSRTA